MASQDHEGRGDLVERLCKALDDGEGDPAVNALAADLMRSLLETLPPDQAAIYEHILQSYLRAAELLGPYAPASEIRDLARLVERPQ